MGLQEQIAEAIIAAFDELGGDPQGAVEAAMRAENVDTWIQQETATVAVVGGLEMAFPGVHALTIPAGITFLMHRMAYISRGIGALKNAYIVETPYYSDMRNILTVWSNDSYYNANLLDYKAIGLDVFLHVLSDDGYRDLMSAIEKTTHLKTDTVITNTLNVLKMLADEFANDERAMRLVRVLTDEDTADRAIAAAQNRVAAADGVPVNRPMSRRLSARLAMRLAGQLSARIPAKLVVGFIPLAGALVNAFFNAQTLLSMADAARKYYNNTFTMPDLMALTTATEKTE